MSNLLNETFQKHLGLLKQKLQLKEVTDQEVVEKAAEQKNKFKSGERFGVGIKTIHNDIVDLIENPDSEFKQYYPDWTRENFLLYYKELFGKEYSELNEISDWGFTEREILEKVLQTLERDVEWPLTDVISEQEVKKLLDPIYIKIQELLSSEK